MARLFGKQRPDPIFRVFVASDLHGSTTCFRKLLQAPDFYSADALIIAGDLTGKMIVPIVQDGDGKYVSYFQESEWLVATDEIEDHEQMIELSGLYPYRTTREEIDDLRESPEQLDAIFHELVRSRLQSWIDLAEEKLSASGCRLFVVPGNDDYLEIDDILRGGTKVLLIDGARAELTEDHEIFGLGVSNPTPWHAPRDISEDEIHRRLDAGISTLGAPERAVLVVHVPPAESGLDVAPELDATRRPTRGGQNLVHVGSTAVRDCIRETQPLLTLHGHIHESRGIDHIGRTVCINPGSEYAEGILRGVLVNLGREKVLGHLFVSG